MAKVVQNGHMIASLVGSDLFTVHNDGEEVVVRAEQTGGYVEFGDLENLEAEDGKDEVDLATVSIDDERLPSTITFSAAEMTQYDDGIIVIGDQIKTP